MVGVLLGVLLICGKKYTLNMEVDFASGNPNLDILIFAVQG